MKIAKCLKNHVDIGYCIVKEEKVYPIDKILGIHLESFQELVENWDDISREIHRKLTEAKGIEMKDVEFIAPIKRPVRNLICVGKNYLDHARELEGKTANLTGIPSEPIYFSKLVGEILGDGKPLVVDSSVTTQVDYEVELGLIIKRECKDVKAADAADVVFGYAVFNDYSARDLQTRHIQWHRGKSLDGFTAMGSFIITADEIDFPPSLKIKSYVNEELRQEGVTDNLIFSLPTLLEDFSKGLTLLPGDIMITGTPSGVGMGFNPPRYLKDNDVVKCEIERLGTLCNRVVMKK